MSGCCAGSLVAMHVEGGSEGVSSQEALEGRMHVATQLSPQGDSLVATGARTVAGTE